MGKHRSNVTKFPRVNGKTPIEPPVENIQNQSVIVERHVIPDNKVKKILRLFEDSRSIMVMSNPTPENPEGVHSLSPYRHYLLWREIGKVINRNISGGGQWNINFPNSPLGPYVITKSVSHGNIDPGV